MQKVASVVLLCDTSIMGVTDCSSCVRPVREREPAPQGTARDPCSLTEQAQATQTCPAHEPRIPRLRSGILNLPPTCRPSPQTPSDDMSHQAGHTHYTQTNKTKTKQACCLRPALRPARQRACWPVSACRPACAPARSLSPRQPCPRTRCAADTRGCPCRRRCRRRAYRSTGYRRACVCQRW